MINNEIKGGLARLLATENLIVEHKRCPTASFDIDNRILTLPMWEKASGDVYDMLVAHEVGHALFTPTEWFGKVDFPKSYLNIVEDVRVEKLMKRRYQGLPKTFAKGYSELTESNFFGIEGDDISNYNLIDRINLHYKIGPFACVPFVENERQYVDRAYEIESFDDAVNLAREIYAFSKEQEEQEEVEENETQFNPNDSGEASDQMESQQFDNDNSEESDSDQGGSMNDNAMEDSGADDSSGHGGTHNADDVKTQDNFDEKIESLNNNTRNNLKYFEIPAQVDLNHLVADWTEIHNWIDKTKNDFDNIDSDGYRKNGYDIADNSYRAFRKQSQKEVNYLIKEFEMRKSADAYARAAVSKTGVLDTSKLHTYMFREDIFKKVTIVPDGKNHGLIFVLDWSGSMSNVLVNTLKQLLSLTNFCKKGQIPFEVYAFTNEWEIARRAAANNSTRSPQGSLDYMYSNSQSGLKGIKEKEFFVSQYFTMMNIISSRSNSRDYERQCLNIWREAYAFDRYGGYSNTPGMGLSGTPLNEAIVSLNHIIPKFRKDNDLQKVNVCVLTDGEGCVSSVGRAYSNDPDGEIRRVSPTQINTDYCLRDRQTGRIYPQLKNGNECLTNNLIQQVRDRNPGVNILGFRILPSNLPNFIRQYGGWRDDFEKLMKDWKKDHSVVIKNPIAFTSLYAISNNSVSLDPQLTFSAGATKATITKAFKSMTKTKQNNKKILSSFIEHIA
jgi:hypothetical protein